MKYGLRLHCVINVYGTKTQSSFKNSIWCYFWIIPDARNNGRTALYGAPYICRGHLRPQQEPALARKPDLRTFWGAAKKRKKNDREMLMNLTWGGVKKRLLPNNLTMRDSFPPAEAIHGNRLEGLVIALPLSSPFSFTHTQTDEKTPTRHLSHSGRWLAHSYMCGETHASPTPRPHIPPHAHPRYMEVLHV